MNRLLICVALALACAPNSLFATEVCVPEPDSACPTPDVAKYCMNVINLNCNSGIKSLSLAYTVAPPIGDVQAVCDFESGRYRCQAWGQGPDISYTWALNGRPGLSFVTPPHGDKVALINCQPNGTNLVHLTVTSKFGLSTTVSTNLYCGYMGEY